MPREDRDALYDIVDAARLIVAYTQGMDFGTVEKTQVVQDAVIRRFEIIGEATKPLSPTMRQQHPEIPWEDMAGMRDRVIHGYDAVDWRIVWRATQESVPDLLVAVERILSQSTDRST